MSYDGGVSRSRAHLEAAVTVAVTKGVPVSKKRKPSKPAGTTGQDPALGLQNEIGRLRLGGLPFWHFRKGSAQGVEIVSLSVLVWHL
jgi:hypothetical protein